MALSVVGYIRVSGAAQANEGQSLDIQRDEIEKYCLSNDLNLVYIFEDVESGESAEKRKGLQAALQMLESDSVAAMVVHKQDRFARSVYDAEDIRRRLKRQGKSLLSVADPIEWLSDEGEMMYQFKSVFAEYERKQIYKRCRSGYERKARSGGYASGSPPFGFSSMRGKLIKNESEFQVLTMIFDLRGKGFSYRYIVNLLNQQGIRTKRGKAWTYGGLRVLMHRLNTNKTKLRNLQEVKALIA